MEANWEEPPTPLRQAERDNTGNRYVQTMGGGGSFFIFLSFLFVPSLLEEEIAGLLFAAFWAQGPIQKRKRKRSDGIGLKHRQGRGGPQASFGTANPWVRFGHGKRLLTQQLCIAPARIQPTQQTVLLLNSEGKWMVFVESFCPRAGVCTTGETRHPSLGGGAHQ